MLKPRTTPGSQVKSLDGDGWRLEIPAGPAGRYRLAQLDDLDGLPRRSLPWRAPLRFKLQARASSAQIPGTWGFGLWNDPFGFSLGFGGGQRFPALPDAAWFFFASPHNYLSLQDDLPANGGMAVTFRSKPLPAPLLALGALSVPLLALHPFSRLLRRLGRRFVEQGASSLEINPVEWHTYEVVWEAERTVFGIDKKLVLETGVSPHGPLVLVIWVDNQYAAWHPDGRLHWGTLANPEPAWVEVREIQISPA